VPDRDVYVGLAGSDSQGDGSRARPYRTLARAAREARPGVAVRLLPGTYAGGNYLERLAGTSTAPIWLGGVPGEPRPVIVGGSGGLHLSRVRYLVVEHLEVRGATGNGINCDDGGEYGNGEATRWVVFRHLAIRNIGTGVNDYWVLDCEFTQGSAGGSGIDQVGCHRGVIARCRFRSPGSNAIQCKGGSAAIEIRGNHFVQAGQRAINLGGSTGFEFFRPPLVAGQVHFEASAIRVVANLFEGADTPVAFVGCTDSMVAHNTIVNPTRWLFRILQETVSSGGFEFGACGDSQFLNNLVYFQRGALNTYVNIGPNTAPGSFRFAHNLWYAHDQPAQSRPNLPAAETGGRSGQDPLLRGVATGDFDLLEGSPAIGAGSGAAAVSADYRHACYAALPSIGAFEAVPIVPVDTDGDGLPDWWERHFELDPHQAADAAQDPDQDGQSNAAEWVAGTDPRDARSAFSVLAWNSEEGALLFRVATVAQRQYAVERSGTLAAGSWETVATLAGTGVAVQFRESSLPGPPLAADRYYRVRVNPPRTVSGVETRGQG